LIEASHVYLIHKDSQRSLDYLSGYFASVHALIEDAAGDAKNAYFGARLDRPPRKWSAAEIDAAFNPAIAMAAFDTQELAVEPHALARTFREAIAATPGIELRLARTVQSVANSGARLRVVSNGPDGPAQDDYDYVVNALWDGRLAIDTTFGIRPTRPWLYRFRYGLRLESREVLETPLSMTIVHGQFGGVACYANGAMYLYWYPACKVGVSGSLDPPVWPVHAEEPLRSRIIGDTIGRLAEIVPTLGAVGREIFAAASVVGGNIFGWGSTDTDDPASELHRRHEIGVVSIGNYHSVDPGKLTMAPYFAEICADRIVPP
jgi:hypothetical protein